MQSNLTREQTPSRCSKPIIRSLSHPARADRGGRDALVCQRAGLRRRAPITGPPWVFCTISTLKTGPRSTAGKPRSCCAPAGVGEGHDSLHLFAWLWPVLRRGARA